jgi:ABC-type multidrug transport system fused ATPase/permease subunit
MSSHAETNPPVGKAPQPLGRPWQLLGPYTRGSRHLSLAFGAATFLASLLEAALLVLVVRLGAAIAAGDERVDIAAGPLQLTEVGVGRLFAVGLVVLASLAGLAVASSMAAARISMASLVAARLQTIDAFTSARWTTQARERTGHLQELLAVDTKRVSQAVMVLTEGVTAVLAFVALIASALLISPVGASTILLGVAALYLLLRPVTRLTRSRSRQHAGENLSFSGEVAQSVALAREIKAFHVGEAVRQRIAGHAGDTTRSGYTTRLLAALTPRLYVQAALLLVVVGMLAVWAMDLGEVAQLGAVVLLLVRALTYSQTLQGAIQQLNEAAPYLERLRGAQARYRSDAEPEGGVELGPVESITFQHVGFSYEVGRPVLHDVSFEIWRGEMIGVVGPSGSGKSTLVQILLGLRHTVTGQYLVNGVRAEEHERSSWFRQIAFVPQDNQLLAGTVAQNIAFFRSGVGQAEIVRAARLAHLHDDVMAMAEGYDTVLGPGISDLSGGQRQRLGLARALAGNPSVLVLDEPTSALDMRSEKLVQETLEALHGSLTIVIVAHRMTTLRRCDRIMVLRDGHLDAFEPAGELLRSNAFYREVSELSRLGAPAEHPGGP